MQESGSRVRLLAIGGIVGPVAFVAAWALSGRVAPGYSSIDDAISELARIGATTRLAMTLGFVVFGVGVCAYSVALRAAVSGPAWRAARVTGLATLGVAAVPLGSLSDGLHGAFAGVGYLALALTPILVARSDASRGSGAWRGTSWAAGVLCGLSLLASVAGPHHGLFQRVGLGIGDAWLVLSAVLILAGGTLTRCP